MAGADAVSRYELGQLVLRSRGISAALPSATLAGSGLHRPADVRLDCRRARAALTTPLRGIHQFLEAV